VSRKEEEKKIFLKLIVGKINVLKNSIKNGENKF